VSNVFSLVVKAVLMQLLALCK